MKTKNRSLKCESLENRQLMAGNVTVNVEWNEVIVRGDSKANQIEVFQLDNGAYRISGLNGTTVNGKSFVDRTSSDRDLRIFMGAGDDKVILGNNFSRAAMIVEDLEIDMGTGLDGLAVANVKHTDNQPMLLRMGGAENERDIVSVQKVTSTNGIKIETGGGNDGVEVIKTSVKGKLDVNLGAGNDDLWLVDAFFASNNINGGSGSDGYKRTGGNSVTKISFERNL